MKVVVTGAGGMLAAALVPALEQAGHGVVPLRRADADVTDFDTLATVVEDVAPDWIAHLAGETDVDGCESDPDRADRVNRLGARHAALAAARSGAAILAISTDYVFDGTATSPYREDDPVAPRSVYGASKWAGEQAVREVHDRHLIVRTSWMFGRGGRNFVDTIVSRARAGEALKVVDDQRGSPTWTVDLAGALTGLMAQEARGTVHVTNSGDCSWYDLAAYALDRAGVCADIGRTSTAALARPARRPLYSVLSNHRYEALTGERMPHWSDAVNRYLASPAAG